MKNILTLAFFFTFSIIIFNSCNQRITETKIIKETGYELNISSNQKALLILFPCFSCNIDHTKAEAKFLENMDKIGISTLLLDYNQKLFLTDKEKTDLEKELNQILDKHSINKNNVYIGGFSSGGNIAILLGNDLIKTKNKLQPKGVFVVDSPLDLENLYQGAQKDIQEKSNNDAVEEGHFIINMFDENLGKPVDSIQNYAYYSPYLISKNTVENLKIQKILKFDFIVSLI